MASSTMVFYTADAFDFAAAILFLKDAKRVKREGWATGEYVTLFGAVANTTISDATKAAELGVATGTSCNFSQYICKATATAFVPYIPTQEDMLATDWAVC